MGHIRRFTLNERISVTLGRDEPDEPIVVAISQNYDEARQLPGIVVMTPEDWAEFARQAPTIIDQMSCPNPSCDIPWHQDRGAARMAAAGHTCTTTTTEAGCRRCRAEGSSWHRDHPDHPEESTSE